MANYRVVISDAQATDQDHVKLLCTIEKENDVGGWDVMAGGPSSIYLATSEVLAMLRRDISDAEKRAGLLGMLRASAQALPIVAGDQVVDQVEALLPAGWPVTVGL